VHLVHQPGPLPEPQRNFAATDWALMLGLMLVGLLLRLWWWSGYGLADDESFKRAIESIVQGGVLANAYGYRATWWMPTALLCRVLGFTEAGLILPVTAISTLGIGLVYVFGKSLWGRAGGLVAALLLIVHPVDFAWSTMFANDLFQSFFAALSMLLFLHATDAGTSTRKRRLFFFAALSLFLAYHAKVTAVALVPALLVIAWWRRQRLWPEATTFVGVAALLFGLSALGSIALTGGPFGPYEIDMWLGGLRAPDAPHFRPLTWFQLGEYPRMLFARNRLGDLVYSVYPHLLVLFALLAWPLRLRSSKELWVWPVVVFCLMEFQMTRVGGVWVTMLRNIRHSHALVYPLVLLLAGYFVSLHARWPRLARAVLAGVLLYSGWMSVSVASKTHEAFADRRSVAQFLATLPRKPVYSDIQLGWSIPVHATGSAPIVFQPLEMNTLMRRVQIAAIQAGYLVTGGGREPYYGCTDCIPGAGELPPGRWRLLKEFPGPTHPTPWRREPARVWEAVSPGS
jgi:Dolichyl-phosphate-mannose-protein mannosyltransferase